MGRELIPSACIFTANYIIGEVVCGYMVTYSSRNTDFSNHGHYSSPYANFASALHWIVVSSCGLYICLHPNHIIPPHVGYSKENHACFIAVFSKISKITHHHIYTRFSVVAVLSSFGKHHWQNVACKVTAICFDFCDLL